MGDNRDESSDSRFWAGSPKEGMVPRENLKGKAMFIWVSLDHEGNDCAGNLWSGDSLFNVRWSRFGRAIR